MKFSFWTPVTKFSCDRDIVVATIVIELSLNKKFTRIRKRIRIKAKCDFATCQFHTLSMPFVHIKGPATFVHVGK